MYRTPYVLGTILSILGLSCSDRAAPASSMNNPHLVTYEGDTGPGLGKHIVLIAGDHEYRSEELLPALARILARRYGFKTSVLFTLDDQGFIEPGSSNIKGLELLRDADLMIVAIRFQHFPESEMRHFVDYLNRAGPVFGIRTSTHAFRIEEGPYVKYSWDYEGSDYTSGFGEQVLGETWVGHHGTNHEQSSRIVPLQEKADHPVFRGVTDMHVQSGGYQAYPLDDADILALGHVLNGIGPDAPRDVEKELLPVIWTRTYTGADGRRGRVFTSTHGASEDLLNDGFRRMMVNAVLWTLGLDDAIDAQSDVALVGPYNPVVFSFDGYRRGVRPSDLAGWDAPIMSTSRPTGDENQ